MNSLDCFTAYDIRGQLGTQLDPLAAYRIGLAFAGYLSPKVVVLGGDARLTSPALKQCLAAALLDCGVTVLDLGTCGTEEVYFATQNLDVDAGIEVTASHNPIDYNGMKLVRRQGIPISGDTGLERIRALAESYADAQIEKQLGHWLTDHYSPDAFLNGRATIDANKLMHHPLYREVDNREPFVEHVLGYVEPANLNGMKVVVNAGNGAAGPTLDAIEKGLEKRGVAVQFVKLNHTADGTFPNGIPNPLLVENQAETGDAVVAHQADFGIAWDGDFDRCFLFDHTGRFIDGYYIVGLLAEAFLDKYPGETVLYDPRVYWNTQDIAARKGGVAVQTKTGHAFVKERMRKEKAVYGGEMSAHHYFRDFGYCDSGMIPWLLVAELMTIKGRSLAELVDARIAAFPTSGEINRVLVDPDKAMERVKSVYLSTANKLDQTDGLDFEFESWRFNVRKSNTEPVLRVNVESRADEPLLKRELTNLLAVIDSCDGDL